MTELTPEMSAKFAEKVAEYAKNPDKRLKEALNNQNYNMVRAILKLDLNDSAITFEELMIKTLYITEHFPEQAKLIFEKFALSKLHKGLETDSHLWDEDYFLTHQSYLTLNFALERFIHLVHVKQELMNKKVNNNLTNSPVVVNRQQYKPETFNKDFEEAKNSKLNVIEFVKENSLICAIVVIALVALFLLL